MSECLFVRVDVSLEGDPFLMSETDLSKCRALESCLWEIKVDHGHMLVTCYLNASHTCAACMSCIESRHRIGKC